MKIKRELDKFDMEAEREGSAIRSSNLLRVSIARGKRTQKDQKRQDRGDGIQDARIQGRYIIMG